MLRHGINDVLRRLAKSEERLLRSDFLAPAVPSARVAVRLGGVICRFRMERAFAGWGVFRPSGPDTAALVRRATLAERQEYLERLPARRMILCCRQGHDWLGWPAHHGDRRFGAPALTRVRLADEAEQFAVIVTRFDGAQCWFDRPDERADPAAAAYLRRAWMEQAAPDSLHRRGLTLEERTALAAALQLRRQSESQRTEARLHQALAHGGGQLQGFREQDDCLRVEFAVDGERHVSLVGKRDLTVQLAGICLSGEDRRFDLQSLVSVLREARTEDVPRVGAEIGEISEDQYWRVHPREP